MNKNQWVLMLVFFTAGAAFIPLDHIYPAAPPINSLKHACFAALFLAALALKKRHADQTVMSLAFFFAATGDLLLKYKIIVFGMIGFLMSYLTLTAVFLAGTAGFAGRIRPAIPVLLVFVPNLIVLLPHTGSYVWGACLFALVLCVMSASAIGTLFSGRYRSAVARRIALAGFLILISDLGVAHKAFNPAFVNQFVPWLESTVWATFLSAWSLIAVTIAEDELF